jgi:hypothetical protein
MKKLSSGHLLIAIGALVVIVAVAAKYEVDEQLRSYAIAVILPMLVKLLMDSQQQVADGKQRDEKIEQVATTMETVQKQTNHNLEVLTEKLDKATAKNVASDLKDSTAAATDAANAKHKKGGE